MRMHSILLALTVLAGLLFSLPATAQQSIIVLDGSGSMWAQVEGRSRIEIARESLKEALAGVPADMELGLMAYGHRTRGECSDIEMLVEPAAGTADRIASAAMSLNPRGKTPLSAAVRQAAEALRFTEDKATVVLITDGIETCEADPCALAGELEAAGIDFTVNVVGFGLSAEEGAQVQCLADLTGGVYIGAGDGAGLRDAINVAVNELPAPEPEPIPEPEPVSAINFAPTVILAEGEDPMLESEGFLTWQFHRTAPDGTAGEWLRTEYGSAYRGEIEPGEYVLSARLDYAVTSQPLTITAGEVARPEFNLNAGRLTIRPIAYEGGEIDPNAAVFMEFANGESTTFYGETRTFAPAGATRITVRIGSATLEETLQVTAGEYLSHDIVVGVGRATVNAYYTGDMKVEDGNLFTEILSGSKDLQGNRKSFAYKYGPDSSFDLLPGDYVAMSRFDALTVEQPFTVVAGEGVDVAVPLNAGVLFIDAPGAYWIEVWSAAKDIQGNRKSFGGVYDVTSNRTLPAGDYQVIVTYEGDAAKKEAAASVRAGERSEIGVQ